MPATHNAAVGIQAQDDNLPIVQRRGIEGFENPVFQWRDPCASVFSFFTSLLLFVCV
jgi:hypothetical protein